MNNLNYYLGVFFKAPSKKTTKKTTTKICSDAQCGKQAVNDRDSFCPSCGSIYWVDSQEYEVDEVFNVMNNDLIGEDRFCVCENNRYLFSNILSIGIDESRFYEITKKEREYAINIFLMEHGKEIKILEEEYNTSIELHYGVFSTY
jgi:hypothetical protein